MGASVMLLVADAVAGMLSEQLKRPVTRVWLPDVREPAASLAAARIDVVPTGASLERIARNAWQQLVEIQVAVRQYVDPAGEDTAVDAVMNLFDSVIVAFEQVTQLPGYPASVNGIVVNEPIDYDMLRETSVVMAIVQATYVVPMKG